MGANKGVTLPEESARARRRLSATSLPKLAGTAVAAGDGTLTVAPISLGWIVLPEAKAKACM